MVALAFSMLMLIVLAGYYGTTVAAIALPNQGQSEQSYVYIVETPVSWQFPAQRIVVVLGVSDTVT